MRDPAEYFHLPTKKRITRLILLILASITHLWRATTTMNHAIMTDSLKLNVAGKPVVLADLAQAMATVNDHDSALLGTFLLRHQPELILSYPQPDGLS